MKPALGISILPRLYVSAPMVNKISQIWEMLRASRSAICWKLVLSLPGILNASGAFFFILQRL